MNVAAAAPSGGLAAELAAARVALRTEADAVARLVDRVDERFERAVLLIANVQGRVVVTGLGKSGVVGRKIAATLASLGTCAFFVHATEAMHGDSGMLHQSDLLLALSNSGHTEEVCEFAALAKDKGAGVLALTGCRGGSRLAALADLCLDVSVEREADCHDLAPTASTTAALAMGDALAVALAVHRGFSPDDFGRHHPAGALGRRLRRPEATA